MMSTIHLLLCILPLFLVAYSYDGPLYDSSAYTECRAYPEDPLYSGGILQDAQNFSFDDSQNYSPTFLLHNMIPSFYTFSAWISIKGGDQSLIRARLTTNNVTYTCIGTVIGKQGCWSFLKGDFLFGSAISSTIIGNLPYQKWFLKRFNAAVFENELKWYATEPEPGKVNFTTADQMLGFVRANEITTRGHNIFWENPGFNPAWVVKLNDTDLQHAVNSRISSLMSRFRGEFIHWDVSNELLHYDFYEQRLGPNATLEFLQTIRKADPLATLFLNEYNVVETYDDFKSTVDSFVERLKQLKRGEFSMDGIGLQGHFTVPNPPFIRAVLDKLATLGLPIWFTELDIVLTIDRQTQAVFLEQILREGFSHSSVKGIMLWSAINPKGFYQMCLTDNDFNNLPTGEIVDKLLQEWETGKTIGMTDELGSFSFHGFLGEYKIEVSYGNTSAISTFSLTQGDETRHFNIQL